MKKVLIVCGVILLLFVISGCQDEDVAGKATDYPCTPGELGTDDEHGNCAICNEHSQWEKNEELETILSEQAPWCFEGCVELSSDVFWQNWRPPLTKVGDCGYCWPDGVEPIDLNALFENLKDEIMKGLKELKRKFYWRRLLGL